MKGWSIIGIVARFLPLGSLVQSPSDGEVFVGDRDHWEISYGNGDRSILDVVQLIKVTQFEPPQFRELTYLTGTSSLQELDYQNRYAIQAWSYNRYV
jgi:hypothetical protein